VKAYSPLKLLHMHFVDLSDFERFLCQSRAGEACAATSLLDVTGGFSAPN
jgi:hypothetical protein